MCEGTDSCFGAVEAGNYELCPDSLICPGCNNRQTRSLAAELSQCPLYSGTSAAVINKLPKQTMRFSVLKGEITISF